LSPEGTKQTAVGKRRTLLTKMYSENPDLFWDKIELSITKGFSKTIEGESINPGGVAKWLDKSLLDIKASNEDSKGNYNQLPEIGGKMIPFVYGEVMALMTDEKLVDTDLFDSLMLQMNRFFDGFLNKSDQSPEGVLKSPERDAQELIVELFGVEDNMLSPGGIATPESLSFKIYMNKYFGGEFPLFMKYTLGDAQNFIDFMNSPESEQIINFLQIEPVKERLQQIVDRMKSKGKVNRAIKNLIKIADLDA